MIKSVNTAGFIIDEGTGSAIVVTTPAWCHILSIISDNYRSSNKGDQYILMLIK